MSDFNTKALELLNHAAALIESAEPDPNFRSPEAEDLLDRIHAMEMAERADEEYQDMESWLEDVRRANICDLMA